MVEKPAQFSEFVITLHPDSNAVSLPFKPVFLL